MASRINAIVAVLRAHKRLNRPLDMQAIADGMQIEQVLFLSFEFRRWLTISMLGSSSSHQRQARYCGRRCWFATYV